ncbi:hypothetical protein SLEP1_g54673 [Rubroshorea leprosula]|uniref:Uncharacterized protein n=1 Tax=Rubroshorea leprosula TaxID=152421 RepID=A0AAV5MD60_9ROSI|nr:hypothetical protein SLEP1_g54673 [Rubroshorea leprosula]
MVTPASLNDGIKMNSSPISQQISQDKIDENNCSILQAVNDDNDTFLTVQVNDLEGLEEISISTAMEIEGPKMLGEDDIIGGMLYFVKLYFMKLYIVKFIKVCNALI